MRKYIILIVTLFILFGWVYMRQQRQFYHVANDMYITIWHDYIIFGKYTSFFRPTNRNNYLLIPARAVDICFEDSLSFVLYSNSEEEISYSLQNYHLTESYQGKRTHHLDFLNYKNIFYSNKPYCEIELCKERGRYVPYIDVFYDSAYVRTVYGYEDLLQNTVDSSIYIIALKSRIAETQDEIELQNRILKMTNIEK